MHLLNSLTGLCMTAETEVCLIISWWLYVTNSRMYINCWEKKERGKGEFCCKSVFKTLSIFLLYSIKSRPLLTRAKLLLFFTETWGDFSTFLLFWMKFTKSYQGIQYILYRTSVKQWLWDCEILESNMDIPCSVIYFFIYLCD